MRQNFFRHRFGFVYAATAAGYRSRLAAVLFCVVGLNGCANMPFAPRNVAHSRTFVADFATAWSAALETVASASDVLQNRDLGTISTGWFNNTDARNFYEAFSPEDHFNRARYRLFLLVREGMKNGKKATVVRIQLEQQVEKSPFSNWETIESNGLQEAVYLYRVGRLIALQQYADRKEAEKSKDLKLSL